MANYSFTQYVPSFIKAVGDNTRSYVLKFADLPESDASNENSFASDIQGSGLKSTQQLDVDWSKFENHTFFMSAEAKVNLAFELIINGYPFDGSKEEIDSFFSNLTGFEKWVFDQFPKYKGELLFSGTQLSETTSDKGTYIVVKDIPGSMFPSLNPDATVKSSVLNPKNGKSLSVEMQLFVPNVQTAGTQIVFQKLNSNNNHGISLRLNPTVSTDEVEAQFDVFSGSSSMTVSSQIKKGEFNHLCVVLDKESNDNVLRFYNNETLKATSDSVYLTDLDIDYNDFIIGSGTSYKVVSTIVTPQQTLSGVIDELRVFHNVRSVLQQKSYAKKSIFSTSDLKLYYRFNEPAPPLSPIVGDVTNAIVLDSSGNSLHSYIRNFDDSLRIDAETDTTSNMIYEKLSTCPVLFPAYANVVSLNNDLLTSAADFDAENPNLITKLIPRHYLLEGAALEGFETALQNNGSQYAGTGVPGQGKLNNVQLLLSLLYIWAKFFDEIKLFLDVFSTIKYVSYDTRESAPDNFLFDIAKSYGFYIPPLFTNSTVEQYLQGENIDPLFKSNESLTLQQVQNSILRRVLVNLPAVIRSKGTQHSIKSFLRAIGIDPDNSMRFREYGGPTYKYLSKSRELKSDVTSMINFISSSLVTSQYLSGSRIEAGKPEIAGNYVQGPNYGFHGISDDPNDGLFTSGSWTFETAVKYGSATGVMLSTTQSIARMCVTGSGIQNPGLVANLVTYYDDIDPRIDLFLRPGNSVSAPYFKLRLNLDQSSVFNGDVWNISFGCSRNDEIGSIASSSYYLRAGFQNEGEIQAYYTTSSNFFELAGAGSPDENVFRTINSTLNASGTFLSFGSNQMVPKGTTSTYLYLNNSSVVPEDAARSTIFEGRLAKTRFWSKSFTIQEWSEHIRNYQSLGVTDPSKNWNYVYTVSGSFEKLRLDSFSKQTDRTASAPNGSITFLDFSENNMHMFGTGFPTDSDSFLPEIIRYSHLSAYYDEALSIDKIRVRGYLDDALIDANPWASRAPVHQIVRSESPTDDTRFSIDFSLVGALNNDIVNMFSTFEALENAIGSPELVYSPDYPDLETLRNIYFNRLKEKLNFKAFFEFYSWFDSSISNFIEQLIPRKTVYKGTNFIVESHMLERHKQEYYSSEIYLGENDRNRIKDNLLLQQIAGTLRRF